MLAAVTTKKTEPRVRALFAIVVTLLLAASRCDKGSAARSGAGGAKKPVKLAFVTNTVSDLWKIAAAGIHKYEKEGNVQVDMKMPPNGRPEEQNQILENLVSQGYDAITLTVDAPNDQVPVLNKAAEKAKLITTDSDAPRSNRMLYIATNNSQAPQLPG